MAVAPKSLIVTASINGGGPPKQRSPFQPVTPDEIVQEAVASWKAGAAIVHFHARTDDGQTTMDVSSYAQIIREIRSRGCDAILNISCGDDGGQATHDVRTAALLAGAEMASLPAGSYNSRGRIYDNRPSYQRAALEIMKRQSIKPDVEILEVGWIGGIGTWLAEGLIEAPVSYVFGFGLSGAMDIDPKLIPILCERLPHRAAWTVCCVTNDPVAHFQMGMSAFLNGGHVRVGIEDCAYSAPGVFAESNAELVSRWAQVAAVGDRALATPAQARTLLGLRQLSE